MKNLILAIAVFAVMLGGVILVDVMMENKMNDMISECDVLIAEVDNGDWDAIQMHYDNISLEWYEFRDTLFLLVNHTDIDNVDFAMIELNSMIEAKELSHVKNYAENLKFYMDELLDTEDVSWENIF